MPVVDKYFKDFSEDIKKVGYDPQIRLHFFHRGKSGIFAGARLLEKLSNQIPKSVLVYYLEDGVPFQSGQTIVILEGPASEVSLWETTVDGILTYCGVATGMRDCVAAAGGKPVLDMAARHYPPELAASLSYAAYIGGAAGSSVDNAIKDGIVPSTWKEIGSLPHAAAALWSTFQLSDSDIVTQSHLCYLYDFCYHKGFRFNDLYPSIKAAVVHHTNHPEDNIVVLVDYEGKEQRVIGQAVSLFREKLYAIRLDTTGNRIPTMTDVTEHGVSVDLVKRTRQWLHGRGAPNAKIIATSGFNAEKIAAFEKAGAPVDIYGTGSHVAFWPTKASLGEVKVGDKWVRASKAALTHFVHPGIGSHFTEPSPYPIL